MSTRTYASADPEQAAAYAELTARHTAEHAAFRAELLANGARPVTNEWVMDNAVTGLHEHAAANEANLAEPAAHAGHLYYTDSPHAVRGWCGKPDGHPVAASRDLLAERVEALRDEWLREADPTDPYHSMSFTFAADQLTALLTHTGVQQAPR